MKNVNNRTNVTVNNNLTGKEMKTMEKKIYNEKSMEEILDYLESMDELIDSIDSIYNCSGLGFNAEAFSEDMSALYRVTGEAIDIINSLIIRCDVKTMEIYDKEVEEEFNNEYNDFEVDEYVDEYGDINYDKILKDNLEWTEENIKTIIKKMRRIPSSAKKAGEILSDMNDIVKGICFVNFLFKMICKEYYGN